MHVFKRLRGFLSEDFYLLGAQPRTLETWTAWQFHNPTTQAGFVQAFRLKAPAPRRTFPLAGLDPQRRYRFTDPCTNESFEMAGGPLSSAGLPFELPPLSSRVLVDCPQPYAARARAGLQMTEHDSEVGAGKG